ncbi:MAG: GNAT family N-acetyltransferase [Parvularculaceae bacterium]|nr:GNAT family N-acetyltransferase [Parvularculaceae bacterium]
MTLVIRNAVRGDGALILAFIRELAAYEKLAHEAVAGAADIERALFSEAPKAFALIAEWDGGPCGFALYFFNFSTFVGRHGVYLEDLFVRETHRGKGIGKALLARLARIAKDNGCGRFEWSVLDWNAPSIAFYKSLGAVAMDEWTIYRLAGDALDRLASED